MGQSGTKGVRWGNTNTKTKKETQTETKTKKKTKTFREHLQRATLETFDL